MGKTIGVSELRRNFSAVLDDVAREHTTYTVTRRNKPVAVLLDLGVAVLDELDGHLAGLRGAVVACLYYGTKLYC